MSETTVETPSRVTKQLVANSSNIASVAYDEDQQRLEVEFANGSEYHYSGVEPAVYAGLMAADSVGKYFNANVKNAYRFQKVTG
jgi:hypothetical protein